MWSGFAFRKVYKYREEFYSDFLMAQNKTKKKRIKGDRL